MKKHPATLPFLLVLLFPVLTLGQGSPVLVLSTRISLANVDGRMDHLSVDLKGQRLFATAFNNHTLEVIDLKTGRQVLTIPDLNEPQGAFYDPSTTRLFVACGGDGAVKIFDGTTLQLLQTVTLDLDADNVRYDARGKHIVVGYGGEKFLAVGFRSCTGPPSVTAGSVRLCRSAIFPLTSVGTVTNSCRNPRFAVRFGLRRMSSCTKEATRGARHKCEFEPFFFFGAISLRI